MPTIGGRAAQLHVNADGVPERRLLISSQSAPVSYLKTAKRHLRDSGSVVLCGLGDALANVVALTELLKSQDLAVAQHITTGLQQVDGQTRQAPAPRSCSAYAAPLRAQLVWAAAAHCAAPVVHFQ